MRAGDSIRITDTTTEHFLIAKIDSIKQTDEHIRFSIDNLSHIGGIESGNFCEIEFYNFSLTPDEPDLDAYVKKTGDTMTGSLEIDKNLTVHNRTNFNEKVRINLDPEDGGSSSFVIYGKVDNQDEQLLLRSTFHDKYSRTNDKVEYYGLTDSDLSLVNRKYVDEKIAEEILKVEKAEDETNAHLFGSPYVFRQDKKPENLASGEFTYDSDKSWYAHRYDARGDRIGVSHEDKYTADGMFKVYKHNGAINLICIMHRFEVCRTGQSGNDHMKWEKRQLIYSHYEWLEDGEIYYISDGFLLP